MKRNTLAKQIAAQCDTSGALEVARYGRSLSAIERAAASHLLWRNGFEDVSKRTKSVLADLMFQAIDCADANALRELADFVENYRRTSNPEAPADVTRTKLLILKECCEDGIKPPTIAEVAAMLGVPKTDDGYAALRRMCHTLKLPVTASEKTNKRRNRASKS
jgi:hypothetical protein